MKRLFKYLGRLIGRIFSQSIELDKNANIHDDKSVSTFNIEHIIDDNYDKLKTFNLPVKVHVQAGTVTFIIVDEIFITYIDLVYNTTHIKEYVVTIFYKILYPDPDYTELVLAKKVKTFEEVLQLIKPHNNLKQFIPATNE